MAILISCPCPTQYDKASGRYVACGQRFKVDDRLAGRQVKCPKCGGAVSVPRSTGQSQRAAPPSAQGDPLGLAAQSPRAHVAAPPPVDPVRLADEDDDGALVTPVKGPVAACPHCRQAMPADAPFCPQCAWHRKLHPRFEELAELSDEDDMPGWDRWFREQLAMGESPESASLWIRVVAGALFVTTMAVLAVGFGAWGRYVALGFAAVVIGMIVVAVRAGWRGDLASAVLAWGRTRGWRSLSWPSRKLNHLDLRGTDTNDLAVASLENASEIESLDLEGTPVTDMALPHLARMRKLQFLVLRGTKTTKRGRLLLQRALPHTWIWQ